MEEIDPLILEKNEFISRQCIFVMSPLYPPRNGYYQMFEQNVIPISLPCFVSNSVQIVSVVIKKNIFKSLKCIFTTSQLFLLGKGLGLHLNKCETSLPYNVAYIMTRLKFTQCFWKRRQKSEKFTVTKTDSGQISMRKAPLNLLLW